MARLWTCGFETQSATEWQTTNGAPTISTSVKRTGTASLRCNPTTGVAGIAHTIFSSGQAAGRFFLRAYVRPDSYPSARTAIMGWADNTTGVTGFMCIKMQTDGTLIAGGSGATTGTASAALALNAWARIELDYDDATNTILAYLNGVQWATASGDLGGGNIVRYGVLQTATADLYFDDVAINDTSGSVQTGLPGAGNVVHLRPDSAGDNAGFATTVGGSSNWQRVSEVTPDDATTYNATVATGTTTIDDHGLGSSAGAGLGSTDTVKLVQVGGRIGSNAATAASLVYRIKSQTAGTVLESASVSVALNGWATHKSASPFIHQLTSYVDPQAGGAWTTALLDTAQIGYRSNVSQTTARRVSALWALVETVPVTSQALTLASETDTAQALSRSKRQTLGIATETSAAQALAPLVGVPFSALTDAFADGTVDPVKWPDSYDPGGYSETGGRARIACNTGYNAFSSAAAYRLRESSVHARMWPPADGGATAEAWAQILVQTTTLGTDAIAEVNAATGNLVLASRVGYSDAGQVTLTYNPTDHAWLRIRETGGQLLWDTSPDGVTWTNRRTETSPAWVGDTDLQVQLIAHRDGGVDDVAEFDSFNSGVGQELALTHGAETDSAQALSVLKVQSLGRASATNSAQALSGQKTLALGTASETGTSQVLGRARASALPLAGETDTAQAFAAVKTATLTPAQATEQAQVLAGVRTAALGPAGETAAAQLLARAKTSTLAGAAALEAAQPLAGAKRASLGTASETTTAQAIGAAKAAALPIAEETSAALPLAAASGLVPADETSTAQTLGRAKSTVLGTAGEVGEARPLGRAKTVGLAVAAETATARPLTGGRSRALAPAEETCTARPLSWSRAQQLPTVVEVSEALGLAGGSIAVLGPGAETDEARPVTGRKTQGLAAAVAVESAQPVTGRKTAALGTAGEACTAQVLAGGKRAQLVAAAELAEALRLLVPGAVAPAEEISTARPLVGGKRLSLTPAAEVVEAQQLGTQTQLTLGRAADVADALPVGQRKVFALAAAVDLESAQPLTGTKGIALGRAAEVSRALIGPRVRLTQAIEHCEARALVGRRQRPADHLHTSTSGPVLTPSTSGPGLSTSSSGPRLAATTTSGG